MVKKKKQFNYFWLYYLLFLIPLAFDLYIIILEVNGKENKNMTEGIIIAIISASVTVIVAIIGLILAALKLASKKDTKEIEEKALEIKNQIGEDKNTSLIRDHKEIINKIEKNLENNDSIIISQLKNINDFTEKSKFNRELLGNEFDNLKTIENQIVKNRAIIRDLEDKNIKLINEIEELNKKNKELLKKIKDLESNRDKDFER